MKKLFFGIMGSLMLSTAVLADAIIKKDGSTIKCEILRITKTDIEFDPEGDIPFNIIKINQVTRIEYSNGTVITFADKNAEFKEGVNRHDGFFFRIVNGGGRLNSTARSDKDQYEVKGNSAAMLESSFGYSLNDNLIIYADMLVEGSQKCKATRNGVKITENSQTQSVDMAGFGFGLCCYFSPVNFYLSGSVLASLITFNDIVTSNYSRNKGMLDSTGIGFSLTAGYEWWVSDNWGIGVAAYYHYFKSKSKTDIFYSETFDINAYSYGLAITATYN